MSLVLVIILLTRHFKSVRVNQERGAYFLRQLVDSYQQQYPNSQYYMEVWGSKLKVFLKENSGHTTQHLHLITISVDMEARTFEDSGHYNPRPLDQLTNNFFAWLHDQKPPNEKVAN